MDAYCVVKEQYESLATAADYLQYFRKAYTNFLRFQAKTGPAGLGFLDVDYRTCMEVPT
jgi:hypothetical protein